MPPHSYDPACLDLAEQVLERPDRVKSAIDSARARRLAQRIQDAIEAFLEDEAADAEEME
jgi:predicted secreted protein